MIYKCHVTYGYDIKLTNDIIKKNNNKKGNYSDASP